MARSRASIANRTRHLAARVLVASVLALVASPAFAQYFGQNKVRHRPLDFQVMKTDHFDIYFYPSEREGVEIAARLAERWHARFEHLFARAISSRQVLVLYASQSDFAQTN